MSIAIFIGCFFTYALAAACLYAYLHRAAGAPTLNEYGVAEAQGGMLFSFYGLWLARRYNLWQAAYLARVTESERQKLQIEKARGGTGYAALLELHKVSVLAMGVSEEHCTDELIERHIVTKRANEEAQNSYYLNPYKPFGVCAICTAFWFYTPLYAAAIYALHSHGALCPDAAIWHVFIGLFFAPTAFFMQQRIVEK